MRLSFKLPLFFLVMAIFPVVIVGYLSYQSSLKTIKEGVIDHLFTTNIHKISQLELWISNNASILEMISETYFFKYEYPKELKKHDINTANHLAEHKKIIGYYIKPFINGSDFFELFIIRASDGKVLLSTDYRQEEKYFETRPYFLQGLKNTYIQNIYYSMSLQKPSMTISTPLKNHQGKIIAVLAGRVNMDTLSKIFQTHSNLYHSEDSYLVNAYNFFVTAPKYTNNYTLKKTIHTKAVTAALAKQNGVDFYNDYQGTTVIGAYQWLEKWQLCLLTEIDESEVFGAIYSLRKKVAGVGLAIALTAALIGWGISQTITRPLHHLVDGTIQIGKGDLNHSVSTSSKDELGDLSRAFDGMKDKLKKTLVSRDELTKEIEVRKATEASLRESQKRLNRAEAIGHLGNWRLDLTEENLSWSDEIYRFFDVDPKAYTPTYSGLLELIHPEDRNHLESFIETVILVGEGNIECRFVLPDGRLRYGDICGEIEKDSDDTAIFLFGTIRDTTEVVERKQELEEKNAELERFTYTISHDLKSPIITIKTFAGYLEEDLKQESKERVKKDIFYIQTAAEKMNRLLDELLEMSRIGRVVNPPVEVKWKDLVAEALELVAGSISEKQVEILVDHNNLTFYGDRPRLVEIWQNLVENAVKYMGDQTSPQIKIGLNNEELEIIFFVRDNGMGIDPRYQEKVFGWFEKLNPKSDGTGLGLALIKRIVELYGGKIWLESEGLGKGTCFYFTLPNVINVSSKGVSL